VHVRIGVIAVLTALLMVGVGGAQTFRDPVGDTEGPDIDSVAITHSGTNLEVDIHIANRAQLVREEAVQVELNLDSNAATGDHGIDLHALYVEGEPSEVLLWQNDDYIETNRAAITWSASTAHVRVPLALLGRQVKVEVAALGLGPEDPDDPDLPPEDDPVDVAPDEGVYDYTVTAEARKLLKGTLTFAPAQPRAGKLFRLRNAALQFNDVGTVKPATTTCSAKLAGKRFGKGCSWRLPKTARKKVLLVTVSATYGTERYPLTRRFVVRR
jgi:hypothetical protein